MAEFFTGSDVGKSGLQVKKTTGTPDVRGVTEIQLDSNLTLTPNGGGSVTVQSTGGGSGGVTSVGLTETGSALTITGSPVTTSGTINIAGAGAATDVILGDLTLGTFTDGTVTSVALTETGSALTITGSPVTSSGTINIAGAGNSGQVILGDLSLGTLTSGTVTEVSTSLTGISIADPTTTPAISGTLAVASGGTGANTLTTGGILLGAGTGIITATAQPIDGQLLIGSTGSDPVLSTLTAGTGVSINNTAGAIEISATGTGGTVTSVGLTETGSALNITGSPVTGAGTINIAGAGTSSQVVLGDLTLGTLTSGTVTSVGLTETGSALNITGSPVTGAGTINIAGAGTSSQVVLGDLTLGTLTSGTVTNVSTTLSGISITNPTTTPAISGTLEVASGGTGANSLTDGGILLGSGTGVITATGQPTTGQLLIGITGSDPTLATLTAGTGVAIDDTTTPGAIEISATGSGGTVTSVGLTGGSALTITGSPVTSSGTINIAGAGTSSQVVLGDLTLGTLTSGTMSSFDLTGDNSITDIISNGDTVDIAGGTAITTVGNGPATGSVTVNLDDTAVTPATYGSATQVGQFTVDQQGRITSATNVTIAGGGGSGVDVENSGVALGTATTLNFSTNLAASLLGSTATITASGGSGSGNQPVYKAHDGSASPYWGNNIRLLQDRTGAGGDPDMVNLNDFSYFTPLYNNQTNTGAASANNFQMSGDNNPTGGGRNTTGFVLEVGAEFVLGCGIDNDNKTYPQTIYDFDEYNSNLGGGTITKEAYWISNLNLTGLDNSTLGSLQPGIDIFTKALVKTYNPTDLGKFYVTNNGNITAVYAGEYTGPKGGATYDLFLIKDFGFNYQSGESTLIALQ